MKNIVHKLIGMVDAEQLMRVIEHVTDDEPMAVMRAFDAVFQGDVAGRVEITHGTESAIVDQVDLDDVSDYMYKNQKVSAIKHLRAMTGWGLKESKEYCEMNFGIRNL